ncbi:MAG: hypothetical protein QM805_10440 [Pseudomonas sp.]
MGIDYFNRTGTSKSNMFDNRPNETQYFYTDFDESGAPLNGAHSYEVTFAAGQEPPGEWLLVADAVQRESTCSTPTSSTATPWAPRTRTSSAMPMVR